MPTNSPEYGCYTMIATEEATGNTEEILEVESWSNRESP